jgi:hypothetical protein
VIRIKAAWLAVQPLEMRAGTEWALARVINVFGQARRKRAGNTPRELEVDQSKAPGCQRCGSNSSIRPAGCVGNRASTSLM